MSFGGETVDNIGVTRWFPSASMLTGLLANALGWDRTDGPRHQALQDRLVFAARIDREPAGGARLTDFQTAQLGAGDRGWTTRGAPESRAGGANTYRSPHLRHRDFLADMLVTVALRLVPQDGPPELDELSEALVAPARPIFIGRKPCLPSARLFVGFAAGDSALDALAAWPLSDRSGGGDEREGVRAIWPARESPPWVSPARTYTLADLRHWGASGLHGGGRTVSEGAIDRGRFPAPGTPGTGPS